MALPRFFAAVVACALLAGAPVLADEIQDINQQYIEGELSAALDRANRFLVQNPQDAQARFLKALILADQGKTSDAVAVFNGLTEDHPELPEPYNNLAVLYASQGQYEAAKYALDMAIRAHPGYATAHENLGDIHAKMAAIAYDKAQALDSANTTAKAKRTLIRNMLGETPDKPATAKPLPDPRRPAPAR